MVCTARQCVIIRRVVVVIGLLCLHSLFTYVWYLSLNRKPTQFLQDYGRPIAYFTWGASGSIPALIAVWLVARQKLFGSLAGCFRAAAYLSCGILWLGLSGSVLQDWLTPNRNRCPFRELASNTMA